MDGDTEHDKLVRLDANIDMRLRDGHVSITDLLDWWTRILGHTLEESGWRISPSSPDIDAEYEARVADVGLHGENA